MEKLDKTEDVSPQPAPRICPRCGGTMSFNPRRPVGNLMDALPIHECGGCGYWLEEGGAAAPKPQPAQPAATGKAWNWKKVGFTKKEGKPWDVKG
jgi:hypothetical protein